MKFRFAKEQDKNGIFELYQFAIGTKGCTWTQNYPTMDILEDDIRRGDLVCVEIENRIIAAISIDADEEVSRLSCWSQNMEPSAELARLVVDAKYQRKGIAPQLIEYMYEVLIGRGYKGVHYLVSPNNEKAVHAYEKLAFKKCGECDLYDEHWYCYEKSFGK